MVMVLKKIHMNLLRPLHRRHFAESSAWWSSRSGGDLILDAELLLDCTHALQ